MNQNSPSLSISFLLAVVNVIVLLLIASIIFNMSKAGENLYAGIGLIIISFCLSIIGLFVGYKERNKSMKGYIVGMAIHSIILIGFLILISAFVIGF